MNDLLRVLCVCDYFFSFNLQFKIMNKVSQKNVVSAFGMHVLYAKKMYKRKTQHTAQAILLSHCTRTKMDLLNLFFVWYVLRCICRYFTLVRTFCFMLPTCLSDVNYSAAWIELRFWFSDAPLYITQPTSVELNLSEFYSLPFHSNTNKTLMLVLKNKKEAGFRCERIIARMFDHRINGSIRIEIDSSLFTYANRLL